MCDPLTIAGLALTAGSQVANFAANQQVQSARNDALAAERTRQSGLDQEAAALNLQSQDRYQDFGGQQEAKAQSLGEYFAGQTAQPPSMADALPTSSSNITVREENKQRGEAKAFTDASGAALGDLRSFGDVLGGIGRLQARDAGAIGQIGGFKQGSSGVLPYELDAAGEKGDGLKLLGDLLGGAGSIGTSAGLSGGSLFGLGGATASAAPVPAVMSPAMRLARQSPTLSLGSLYGGGR